MELPLGMECNGMNNGSGTKFMSVLLVATVYSCNCRSGYQTVERIQGSWYLLYHLSQLFNIKFHTVSVSHYPSLGQLARREPRAVFQSNIRTAFEVALLSRWGDSCDRGDRVA